MTDLETKEGQSPETKDGQSLKELAADLAALRTDLAKLSSSVRELLQAQASHTTRRMIGAVDEARQKLAEEVVSAKDQLESHLGTVSADLESAIERSPLMAVMIGAAVGFVIGLVSRSHK